MPSTLPTKLALGTGHYYITRGGLLVATNRLYDSTFHCNKVSGKRAEENLSHFTRKVGERYFVSGLHSSKILMIQQGESCHFLGSHRVQYFLLTQGGFIYLVIP